MIMVTLKLTYPLMIVQMTSMADTGEVDSEA